MKFFIGVVPPEPIYTAILNIQKKFGDNRLEPHITIQPPVTVINEANWIKAIEQVCSSFPPIAIELPSTGYFDAGVLYINVVAEGLNELHYLLVQALQPFEQRDQKKDNNHYHPHLTLGRKWCGFTKEDFVNMEGLAEDYLSKKHVSFIAHFVRVYYKPSSNGRYTLMKDIQLSDNL